MKYQIRRGIFETNSSSVHSITICSENEFNHWENDSSIYFNEWGSDDKPFYTDQEVIKFIIKESDGDMTEKKLLALSHEEFKTVAHEYGFDSYNDLVS